MTETCRRRMSPRRFIEPALLLLILTGAGVLRIADPGNSEFKFDEARLTTMALDLAEGKAFPLQGHFSSLGLPKPPTAVFVYALPYAVSSNPIGAVVFTGVLNTAAVALAWWLTRRYWGSAAALSAALLFATAPWAVIASRKIWEPNLFPLLATACASAGLLGFLEGRRWAQAAHLVLLALAVEVHYAAASLVLMTLVLFALGRRRLSWRALAVGAGLSLLSAAPFLYFAWQHKGAIWRAARALLSQPRTLDTDAWRFWWAQVTGSNIHSLAGPLAFRDFLALLPNLEPVRWALGFAALAGVAWLIWRAAKRGAGVSSRAGAAVAVWAVAPLLAQISHSSPVHLHYFTVMFPAPFIAAGALLATLFTWRPPARWTAGVILVMLALAQAGATVVLLRFVGAHATPGGYGTPVKYQLSAVARAEARGAPIVALAQGDDPLRAEWPAVLEALLRGVPHRIVDGSRLALIPAGGATLLVAPGGEAALGAYRDAGVLAAVDSVAGRPGDARFQIAVLEEQPTLSRFTLVSGPRRLSNGVEVVGYRLTRPADSSALQWQVVWRVVQPPPDRSLEYHVFNHLIDGAGARQGQADAGTFPVSSWAAGDLVVQAFTLDLPPATGHAPYLMRVGMYTYPGMQNQTVMAEAGNVVGDAVTLPLPDW